MDCRINLVEDESHTICTIHYGMYQYLSQIRSSFYCFSATFVLQICFPTGMFISLSILTVLFSGHTSYILTPFRGNHTFTCLGVHAPQRHLGLVICTVLSFPLISAVSCGWQFCCPVDIHKFQLNHTVVVSQTSILTLPHCTYQHTSYIYVLSHIDMQLMHISIWYLMFSFTFVYTFLDTKK